MVKLSDLLDRVLIAQVKIISYDEGGENVLYEGDVKFARFNIEDIDEYKILNIFNFDILKINVYREERI